MISAAHGRFDRAVRQARPAEFSHDPPDRVRRLRRALIGTTALVAVALVGTVLVVPAAPVFAAGGNGGTGGNAVPYSAGGGGANGVKGPGANGSAPASLGYGSGGGGGGAGFSYTGSFGGGHGGNGSNDRGEGGGYGAGGSGGIFTLGGNYGGGIGAYGQPGSYGGGGGGGGGGEHGFVGSHLPGKYVKGGYGGHGGKGSSHTAFVSGGGGGGGGGGFGAVVTSYSGQLSGTGVTIQGGNGGYGGAGGGTTPGTGNGGGGGEGGLGLLLFGTSQVTLGGTSTITGGNGGNGGNGGSWPTAIVGGNGGDGGVGGMGLQQFGAFQVTIGASSTVTGGIGGTGGSGGGGSGLGGYYSFPGKAGTGGIGASVNGGTLINSGTIKGGRGGYAPGGCSYFGCHQGPGGSGGSGVSIDGGTLINSGGTITGGNGGNSSAGLGGDGGSGVSSTGGGYVVNSGTIRGGSAYSHTSGSGGTGVSVTSGNLVNSGTIYGGNGGGYTHAKGGAGVYFNGGTLTNSGTIKGGYSDNNSGLQNNAITFGGGTNKLELWSSSTINGSVAATTGGNDTLALGGPTHGTFNVNLIGMQYQGFEAFEKTGNSIWTLTCTTTCPTAVTPWTINQGTLSISQDANLGAPSGGLAFNGGTLENTSAFTTTRSITLSSGGGTFNTSSDLTASGTISGPGALTKTGAGTLTLTGDNTYAGGTTISAGTLAVSSDGNLGATTGGLAFINGGTLQNTAAFTTARNISLIGPGTLQTDDNLTVSGFITDLIPFVGGALVKTGNGTLTLTGANSYTGGTTISAGSLEVGNGGTTGSIVGDVLNSGSLAFNRADDVVYGGAISGNGVFTKAGAGRLTLTGNSTYTGDTTVAAGALLVNGSLGQTAVSVASGATLSGSGSIGGPVTVQSGGTISGASGATLSMGALSLNAGATTNVLVNGPSFTLFDVASDLTVAGTLNVMTTSGGYRRGVYHVVEYNGTFINNGLTLGSIPSGFITEINTDSPQQLNIKVYDDPTATQFWRGDANPVGGNGTWSATNFNWRNADSRATTLWGGVQAIFHGTPGTVTVEGPQAFQSLEFVVGGYTLVAGNGGALAPTGTAQLWAEGARTTATIAVPITGPGGIEKIGAGTIVLAAENSYSGGTTITSGTLSISSDTNLGAASGGLTFNGGTLENTVGFTTARTITLTNTGTLKTTSDLTATGVISGAGALTKAGAARLTLTGNNTYSGGTIIHAGAVSVSADANLGAASGGLTFHGGTLHNTAAFSTGRAVTFHGGATFDTGADLTLTGVVAGGGTLIKTGDHRLTLSGNNTYAGGTIISAGTLRVGDGGTSGSIQGNVANNGLLAFDRSDTLTYGGTVFGSGGLAKFGAGTLILTGNSFYTGGTTINAGTLQLGNGGTGGSIVGDITNNGTLAVDSASNLVLAGTIAGSGALTKIGTGTLMLAGDNSYAGGTSVNQGSLAISSDSNLGAPSGGLTLNAGELLPTASFATARAITLGPGGGAFFTPGGVTLSASGLLSGPGALTLAGGGTLSLGGSNTYTGATTVKAGSLVVNGSIASSSFLSVDPAGSVGGTGTLPSTAINGGMLAPGNSIGTLTVQGNFTQNGGTYQVELSPSAADRVNVTGSATINGGTVQLLAQPGSYANSTTYTIVNATGGVTGTYNPNVTEDFAFLTPSLSYDANNVFLTLALQQGAFSFGGNTPNEKAVGYALDRSFANASGDFATVINALAGLSTAQGPLALNTISGQPWANFGTMNVATGAMFMNGVGQQMALARGAAAAGQRVALAEACDVASCDGPGPWSAWLSAVGGVGSVQGNRNASTFTYNAGGAAAGLDYRFDPRFLVGLSVGYTHGTQWANGFMGQGWSDTVSVAAYGSFTQGGFYVDALAGYARSTNQLQRQIVFPNLQPRTANGSAGANQFLGQAEAGYRIGIYAPAQASLTPFARVAVQSVTQNAFSEGGANSLSLNVAQQGTNSLRSTIGAELAGELPFGRESKLALALRLGWLHEYDDTSRPISAAFAGAPGNGFTVYGATPARDSAVIGFQASTNIAQATSIYLRYDGEVGSGTDNHALNLGLRMSW